MPIFKNRRDQKLARQWAEHEGSATRWFRLRRPVVDGRLEGADAIAERGRLPTPPQTERAAPSSVLPRRR
jgi:hypothetical protein